MRSGCQEHGKMTSKSSGALFTIEVVGSVPTLLGRHRCIGENRPGPDAGLGADQVQSFRKISRTNLTEPS